MNNYRYSIIIPHKNTPELLERLLKTIPEREDIQVIVVDDNSDELKKPSSEYKNVEFVLLNSEQSKGAGKARNVGLELARGKWLLFADSDDFFAPDFINSIDKYYDSSSDMIVFKANSVNSETLDPSTRNVGLNRKIDECLEGKITSLDMSLSVQQPWCRMIRAELVMNKCIRFDEVIASNDTMFTTKVACMANAISVSNDIIYVITFREGSLWASRKKPQNYLCRIQVGVDRALYLKERGLYYSPLFLLYFDLGFVDIKTNLKALSIIVKKNLLFSNFWKLLKRNIGRC